MRVSATAFAAAAVLILTQSEPIAARNFTVEDLLRTEDIGKATFDPHDRWLVFERLEPFLAMSRFDMLPRASVLRARLFRVALDAPWRVKPLLADPRPGMVAYDFSPDGDRLAIGRLTGGRWRLGIVAMRSGAVRWFDLAPDYDPFRATVRWVSDEQLVTIADPHGEEPWWLRADGFPAEALPKRWQATRSGANAAVTVIGSGRFQDSGSLPPENILALVNASSGHVTTLARGRLLSLEVSPDRTHVALTERGAAVPPPQNRPVSQVDGPVRQVPIIYDLRHHELWRPCSDCDALGQPRWSADSGNVAFLARRAGEDWPDARVLDIDVRRRSVMRRDGGDIVPLLAEFPDGTARAAFHWRGPELLLFGRSIAAPSRRPEWYILRNGKANSLTSGLAEVGPGLSKVGDCSAAMSAADGLWCLDGSSPSHLFGAGVQPSRGSAVGWSSAAGNITISGSIFAGRTLPIGTDGRMEEIEASATGTVLLARRMAANGMKSLILIARDHLATIAEANLHLRDVRPAIVRPLSYALSDGRTVTSWLYLPPTARKGETFPLVAIPYPGMIYGDTPPVGQALGTSRYQTSAQLLAGRGYAVLLPSLPDHSTVDNRVANLVDDLDQAVDAAVATGAVDQQRVALWGHSFGGYAVAIIAAQTCRYASIIASAGVYDLAAVPGSFGLTTRLAPERNFAVAQNFAWAETGQARFGVPPWVDPQRYVDASPVYRLGRIATPMLIVAADRDISPLEQAQQLFSGLARQNKDAKLVTYWGEGHVIASPANLRDYYNQVFDWLRLTLDVPLSIKCDARPR